MLLVQKIIFPPYFAGGNPNRVQKMDEGNPSSIPKQSNESKKSADPRIQFDRKKNGSKFAERSTSTMELLIESNEKITKTHSYKESDSVFGNHNPSNTADSNNDQLPHQSFHRKLQQHRAAKKSNKIMTDQERRERRRKKLIKRSKIGL